MAHVALTDTSPRISYTVTGAQTVFAVPFAFFAFSDLKVYNGETLLTYDATPADATEYSVAGTAVDDGYSSGTVTLGGSVTSTTITIVRDVPVERSTDFPYPSPTLNIQALNTQLDRFTAWAQQILTKISRSVILADSDTTSGLTLPTPAERAGAYLAFGPDGSTIVATGATPDTVPVTAFAETLLAAMNAAGGRSALGLGSLAELSEVDYVNLAAAAIANEAEAKAGTATDKLMNALRTRQSVGGLFGNIILHTPAVKTDTLELPDANWLSVTDLSVTLTPRAATSKFLVLAMVNVGGNSSAGYPMLRLVRSIGGTPTNLGVGAAASSRALVTAGPVSLDSAAVLATVPLVAFDQPASAAEIIFSVSARSGGTSGTGVSWINRSFTDTDNDNYGRTSSILAVLEILPAVA